MDYTFLIFGYFLFCLMTNFLEEKGVVAVVVVVVLPNLFYSIYLYLNTIFLTLSIKKCDSF